MSEHNGPDDDPAARRLELAARTASLIYALISLLWLAWYLIPEHRRRQMVMRAMASIRQRAGRAAYRTGHQAMGLETRGLATNYELPYRLSLMRDWAGKAYDRLRYTQ